MVKPDKMMALMESTTAIIAGADTTSTVITHTLYFLMKHPLTLKRVQAELDDTFGVHDAYTEYTRAIEIPYLTACMSVVQMTGLFRSFSTMTL